MGPAAAATGAAGRVSTTVPRLVARPLRQHRRSGLQDAASREKWGRHHRPCHVARRAGPGPRPIGNAQLRKSVRLHADIPPALAPVTLRGTHRHGETSHGFVTLIMTRYNTTSTPVHFLLGLSLRHCGVDGPRPASPLAHLPQGWSRHRRDLTGRMSGRNTEHQVMVAGLASEAKSLPPACSRTYSAQADTESPMTSLYDFNNTTVGPGRSRLPKQNPPQLPPLPINQSLGAAAKAHPHRTPLIL